MVNNMWVRIPAGWPFRSLSRPTIPPANAAKNRRNPISQEWIMVASFVYLSLTLKSIEINKCQLSYHLCDGCDKLIEVDY